MITAFDMNDEASPRIRHFKPRFEAAPAPDPETGDWAEWQALMGATDRELADDPGGSMTFATEDGFGTQSSSLMALPAPGRPEVKPAWLFAPGSPDKTPYGAVEL